MIFDYFKLIFNDIKNRKFSSFLTFFSISLGILSIFLIFLVSQGFEQSMAEEFEKFGTNRLIVQAEDSSMSSLNFKKGLTSREASLVESKSYVDKVFSYYVKSSTIEFSNEFKRKVLYGVEFDKETFLDLNLKIDQGRFPKRIDKFGVVVGPKFAQDFFFKEVQVGSNVYIKNKKFKVIGILDSVGNPDDDSSVYLSIDTLRDIFEQRDKVDLMYVNVIRDYDIDLASENVEILLENRLGDDTVSVQTFAQVIESFTNVLKIVQVVLAGIGFVSLFVGAIGIINTMFVIVMQKTKEIGIMKAIGARNFDIFCIYVLQAGVFGFLGAFLGVFLGTVLAELFEFWAKSFGYEFLEISVNFSLIFLMLFFGFFVGAFAGFIPSYRASRLKIVETFRK